MASSDCRGLAVRVRDRQLLQRAAAGCPERRGDHSAPRRRQPWRSLADAPGVPRAHPRRVSRPSRLIQLPQSIQFQSDGILSSARRALAGTEQVHAAGSRATQLQTARRDFQCDVRVCPDMAFALPAIPRPAPISTDLVVLARTDMESQVMRWEYPTRLTGCETRRRLPSRSNGARDIGRLGGVFASASTIGWRLSGCAAAVAGDRERPGGRVRSSPRAHPVSADGNSTCPSGQHLWQSQELPRDLDAGQRPDGLRG